MRIFLYICRVGPSLQVEEEEEEGEEQQEGEWRDGEEEDGSEIDDEVVRAWTR